ncbi:hypothetical protein M422DRAFT_273055 [Sphaerobolus stellatus SS14]|uniref:Rit1 N-terminal domain-containing protein n=1 Tax=Sphaerobolus stellatus (strain SS14) TaxID=990650 RepID=A0A0C9TA58_SPHS4|nr:hypothetical protein M422DRAFT_273055 [Sphaerobolus stellatus SS14]
MPIQILVKRNPSTLNSRMVISENEVLTFVDRIRIYFKSYRNMEDSTRHGKRFPDALSKTIPIWCAVINLAIVRKYTSEVRWTASDSHENGALYTPPGSGMSFSGIALYLLFILFSRSEHSQIELRLDVFANKLLSSEFSLPPLQKPLRPIWITPDTSTLPSLTDVDFFPVLCVSTSKLVHEGLERRTAGFTYVQGSGDDHESWSQVSCLSLCP